MRDTIEHPGIIERIDGGRIFVSIVQQSACSGCHAKGICSASDCKDKIVEVQDNSGIYNVNDRVVVCGQASMGFQAVLLAFVVPLIIVLAVLIGGAALGWNEALCGLSGLIVLLPYYVILYCFRERLKKKFVFTLKKLS